MKLWNTDVSDIKIKLINWEFILITPEIEHNKTIRFLIF
jgi:hypothetical protein